MKKLLIVTIYMFIDVEKCQDYKLFHTSCSVSSSIKNQFPQITRPYDVVKFDGKIIQSCAIKASIVLRDVPFLLSDARSSSELAVFNASRRAETESGAPFEKAKRRHA